MKKKKTKQPPKKPTDQVHLVESDSPNGPWTPVPADAVSFQRLDLDKARIQNPALDYAVPIDHRTALGTIGGARELLGLERLERVRAFFGENCTLADVQAWLGKRRIRIEDVNWSALLKLLENESVSSRSPQPATGAKWLMLEKLRSLPEGRGMTTAELLEWLEEQKEYLSDRHVRRLCNELKAYGVRQEGRSWFI